MGRTYGVGGFRGRFRLGVIVGRVGKKKRKREKIEINIFLVPEQDAKNKFIAMTMSQIYSISIHGNINYIALLHSKSTTSLTTEKRSTSSCTKLCRGSKRVQESS